MLVSGPTQTTGAVMTSRTSIASSDQVELIPHVQPDPVRGVRALPKVPPIGPGGPDLVAGSRETLVQGGSHEERCTTCTGRRAAGGRLDRTRTSAGSWRSRRA